jgi:hypothetical protein
VRDAFFFFIVSFFNLYMLLAQPFEDPFKEQYKRKVPFLARCRFASARTKRVLQNLKDRVHYASSRDYQPLMMPEHRYIITSPLPPQSWPSYGGTACYVSSMMLPPPPPFPPFPPLHLPLLPYHALPYSICVHFNSSPCTHSIPKQQQQQQYSSRNYQGQDRSLTTESTLYSPSSSIFADDEKEQVEEDQVKNDRHYQRRQSLDIADHPRLTRSHSDVISNRRQQRRPSINH